jgi:SAM-dependent methyltransferase
MAGGALMTDPTTYFSGRVEYYLRYRPSYPPAIIDLLRRECGLMDDWVVADMGSGPGNLARLFVDRCARVYGVEPNQEMRGAGERLLRAAPGFVSVAGTAEATSLPAASVDLVIAGQAFHWFDPARAGAEFKRILRPPRWVALVWIERGARASPVLAALDQILARYVPNQAETWRRRREATDHATLSAFFAATGYRLATFDSQQVFDFEGLCGWILSSSFVPLPGEPGHGELVRQLREMFDAHERGGTVTVEDDTKVYYGCV